MNRLVAGRSAGTDERFERKFSTELEWKHVRQQLRLYPGRFSEIYQRRFVNNLYLDTGDLHCYHSTVEGAEHRVKVRIRWYGNLFGAIDKPVLELKVKHGLVGSKETFALDSFNMDERFTSETLQALFLRADLPTWVREPLKSMQSVLLNRYERSYFVSASGHFRVTLDSDLRFYALKSVGNCFLNRSADLEHTVLELKYAPEQQLHSSEISNGFPFRLTKNSKYEQGVERLYG